MAFHLTLVWLDASALLFCLLFTLLGRMVMALVWLVLAIAAVTLWAVTAAPIALAHRLIGARR